MYTTIRFINIRFCFVLCTSLVYTTTLAITHCSIPHIGPPWRRTIQLYSKQSQWCAAHITLHQLPGATSRTWSDARLGSAQSCNGTLQLFYPVLLFVSKGMMHPVAPDRTSSHLVRELIEYGIVMDVWHSGGDVKNMPYFQECVLSQEVF